MKRFEMPESMKLASVWVVWGFFTIGVLGWALFVVLEFFDAQQEAASWMQAIGSLLAVGAAIYAVIDQRLSEQRTREERTAVVVKNLQITAKRAVDMISILHFEKQGREHGLESGPRLSSIESAGNALASIRNIDLLQLPRAELIEHVIEITRCLESVTMIYEEKQSNFNDRSGELFDRARAALDRITMS